MAIFTWRFPFDLILFEVKMSSESMNHKRVASLPDRMTLSPEPSSPKSTGSNSRRRSKRVKTDAQSKTFVWSGPFVPFKYFLDIGGQEMETCQLQHVVVHVLFLKEATPVQKVRDCMQKYTKEIQDVQQDEHELALEKFEVDSLPIEVVLSGTESLYKKTRAVDKDMVFRDGVHVSPETKQTHLLNGIRKMLQKVQNTTKEKVYGRNCSSEGLVVFLKHPCLKDRILLSYTAYDMEYFLKTLSVNFRTKRLIPITSMYSPDCTALMRAFIEKFESAAGVLNGNEKDVHFMCRFFYS